MSRGFFGAFGWFAMLAGMAAGIVIIQGGILLILGKIALPRMRSKVYRFVFWFVVWVPLGFAYDFMRREATWLAGNYFKLPMLGPSPMSWTEAFIFAFLASILFTFCSPQWHSSADEKICYRLLDEYSRTRHACFLAEMFRSGSEYTICFRPAPLQKASPNRYAFRYLTIRLEDISNAARNGVLATSTTEMLDRELPALSGSQVDSFTVSGDRPYTDGSRDPSRA